VAVFVDGCFWHGCPEHGHKPKVNTAYWGPKLERNLQRDQITTQRLSNEGWTVVRIWEHVPTSAALRRILTVVSKVTVRSRRLDWVRTP
jgi:DNA mismatch endonuclease (patch repair protein)